MISRHQRVAALGIHQSRLIRTAVHIGLAALIVEFAYLTFQRARLKGPVMVSQGCFELAGFTPDNRAQGVTQIVVGSQSNEHAHVPSHGLIFSQVIIGQNPGLARSVMTGIEFHGLG